MSDLLKIIKNQSKTLYQQLAEKYKVSSPAYVGKIARGERIPQRKNSKGYKIKEELEKLKNEQS